MTFESPQIRQRPTKAKTLDSQRDSAAVRASVLETALELGFGQNSTVANWIFNNPLSEESEDLQHEPEHNTLETRLESPPDVAEATVPISLSGSNSTSDESLSLNSPGNNVPTAPVTTIQVHKHKPSLESPHVHFDDFPAEQLQLFSPFALSLRDARHQETTSNTLGKMSGGSERSRSQDDSSNGNPSHESPSPGPADSGYTSEGQYLSKGKVKKGKDKPEKGNKSSKPKVLDLSKTGEKDAEYASDGGYLSASSTKSLGKSPGRVKSRAMAFFRRRSKKTAQGSDDEDEDVIPPVPAIPVFPRPSSPKPLERRAAPSSPTRSGFSPLSLNLANSSASPSRRRASKSPLPPRASATSPSRPDHVPTSQRPASPVIVSVSAPDVSTPGTIAATIPLPPSIPGTPLSSASFPSTSSSAQLTTGLVSASTSKSISAQSSRQHLSIPPPVPPPTLPLPQTPPSPSVSSNGSIPHSCRKGSPAGPIPVVPITPGSTHALATGRVASPFRPILSPRALPPDKLNGREVTGRQRSITPNSAGLGSTPAFLQRRIQYNPPPSPRHPPPDAPLPPSPNLTQNTRARTPVAPSKFHEHLSSVSSVPTSQILSTPLSTSPAPSVATLSESSSGPSIRSSHISSASDRSRSDPAVRDSLNTPEYRRSATRESTISEGSYSQPIASTLNGPVMGLGSRFSNRSDVSSRVYSPEAQQGVSIYDDDDADVDEAASKYCVDEEDDDASVYPSDDKTAGRRTMYLVEHGELDENGDEIVIAGSQYWGCHEVEAPPPPLPPLPPMPTRPGPGYF